MVGSKVASVQSIFIVILAIFITTSYCLNVGLIAGELKRLRPMVFKKFSQISPVYINVRSEDQTLDKEFFNTLHQKPPKKRSISKPSPSRKYPRSIFSVPKLPYVPYLVPLIPKTPLLPLFPSWFPPPTPYPSPVSPPLSTLASLLKWDTKEKGILQKLMELRRRGALTTEEYIKFKYLLLKK